MSGLEETIARLIDPEAWEPVPPGMGSTTIGIEQQYADQREARKTARRVIDGLDILRDYDPQEDM